MSAYMWWALVVMEWSVGLARGVAGMEGGRGNVQVLQALHCPPCERIHCSPRRALKLQCGGGITTGVCGCCPACAKVAGETCGGSWDHLGKCDEGLVCWYPHPGDSKTDVERKGTCKSVLDALDSDSCRPECTWEFCQANPNAICSARSVSLEKHDCQGVCQHTTCSSCLVLKPPSCPACAPSDTTCLHRYGRCVHSHLADTHHAPACHQNLQSNSEGYFVCLVPDCPNAAN